MKPARPAVDVPPAEMSSRQLGLALAALTAESVANAREIRQRQAALAWRRRHGVPSGVSLKDWLASQPNSVALARSLKAEAVRLKLVAQDVTTDRWLRS